MFFNSFSSEIIITFSIKDKLILISTALFGILILLASQNISMNINKKLFYILASLCIVKALSLILFTLGSFIYDLKTPFNPEDLFGNTIDIISEYIDMYLVSIIVLVVGISFILRKPYFYMQTKTVSYIFVGILFALLSLAMFFAPTLLLKDMYTMNECAQLNGKEKVDCIKSTIVWRIITNK